MRINSLHTLNTDLSHAHVYMLQAGCLSLLKVTKRHAWFSQIAAQELFVIAAVTFPASRLL